MTRRRFVLVLILYLLGLFMGALDTGIVTPARTVIQGDLGVDPSTGIWMITIYTLFYAASIPVMGKLADMFGRKYVYIISISLFGLGSLFCGLSSGFESFSMLVVARAVQAVGGGGIMPIATAEFGTSFPPEKRGMALGLVGGVYGIANVFGASVGSLIMDVFGTGNWAYIFFLNVPISVFIITVGLFALGNHPQEDSGKLDLAGILVVIVMIFSLMYGLKTLDFFDFADSIRDPGVYRYLLIFVVLLPVFILIERRAANPVIDLSYFTDRNILIALIVSIISGFTLMGVIFVPQLSENALHMTTGSGGYLVIFLGLFMGCAAPMSGRLTDRFGAKAVLLCGFTVTIAGALFLVFVTCRYPGLVTVLTGLGIIGLGMGFTVGTPLNYIMLANTDEKDSNSALATLSLVRSIGTAIAPAIMVGFIAHAGLSVQDNIMDVLPEEVKVSKLPYYEEIQEEFDEIRNDPEMAENLEGMDDMELPDMGDIRISDMGTDSDLQIPDDMIETLQNSDVTTVVAATKTLSEYIFDTVTPDILKDIDSGLSKGIDGIDTGRGEILDAVDKMQEGYDGIGEGIAGIRSGIASIEKAETQMKKARRMLTAFKKDKFPRKMTAASFIPAKVRKKMPAQVVASMKKVRSRSALKKQIDTLDSTTSSMEASIPVLQSYMPRMNTLAEGQSLITIMGPEDLNSLPPAVMGQAASITNAEALGGLIGGLNGAVSSQRKAQKQMNKMYRMLKKLSRGKIPKGMSLLDFMPAKAKSKLPGDVKRSMSRIHSTKDIDNALANMEDAKAEMNDSIVEMEQKQKDMQEAMTEMKDSAKDLRDLRKKLEVLRAAVPGAFDEAKENYLISIDERSRMIEAAFQKTLNEGFRHIYLLVVAVSILAILLLLGYSPGRENQRN